MIETCTLEADILPTEYNFHCPQPCNHALHVCVCTEHKCYCELYLGLFGTSWVGTRCAKKGTRTAEDTTGPRRWESCYQKRSTAAGEKWRAEGEGLLDDIRWGATRWGHWPWSNHEGTWHYGRRPWGIEAQCQQQNPSLVKIQERRERKRQENGSTFTTRTDRFTGVGSQKAPTLGTYRAASNWYCLIRDFFVLPCTINSTAANHNIVLASTKLIVMNTWPPCFKSLLQNPSHSLVQRNGRNGSVASSNSTRWLG